MKRGQIDRLERAAEGAGHLATRVARAAIYGQRHTPKTNAGTAAPTRAAVGTGLHSVWEGPKQITGGAPVLRRG